MEIVEPHVPADGTYALSSIIDSLFSRTVPAVFPVDPASLADPKERVVDETPTEPPGLCFGVGSDVYSFPCLAVTPPASFFCSHTPLSFF